jgi:hypothetical protein
MHLLLDDTNPHTFAVPAGIVKVSTCFRGAQGTRISEEYYIAGTEPASNCKAIATKKTSKKAVTAQAQPQ